jgi:autotransporter strand-loop-strand O-heptosyltransferase
LNTQAAWNRNGIDRCGANIQLYLAVDDNNDLYLHTISGNDGKPPMSDYLIEVVYRNYKKFHNVTRNSYLVHNLGQYKKGYTVKAYYEGKEMFNEFLGDDVYKFRELNKLTNVIKKTEKSDKPRQININFVDGAFAEILEEDEKLYQVQFINPKNSKIEYQIDLKSNHWARCSIRYYVDWFIKIKGIDNDYYYEHFLDVTDKRVLIGFESKALGDTLAWMPYVEKFRIDKKCKVICSTFHNNLFKDQYPDIEFIGPGATVHNIHALYRVGVFITNNEYDGTKHPSDPKKEALTKVASDILGLNYVEIKPKLPILATEKKKMASIAIHGTAQCKYWNNPIGWQEVVDFLNKEGYEVRLLSKEVDGYMGNKNPKGVIKIDTPTTEDVLKVIQESELFIGISSGLAWLSWAAGTETILISGFTYKYIEPLDGIRRIINENVCHGCWSDFIFNPGNWNWCPMHEGTSRQFECSKSITSKQVIDEIKLILKRDLIDLQEE